MQAWALIGRILHAGLGSIGPNYATYTPMG
jgi:hypothetical protein